MREDALVEHIRRHFEGLVQEGALALVDDAAIVPPSRKGHTRVVTIDQLHEGVHFLTASGLESAGWRIVARNLSDLAAMGATPAGFVWSLALPDAWLVDDARPLRRFLKGAARACRRYGLPLFGGDLARSPDRFSCSATLWGDVKGDPLTRRGARVGDRVVVSRPLGAAAHGLMLLQRGAPATPAEREREAVRAHLWPTPELALGARLVGRASACMDVSDGLATDARRLAAASEVAIVLERSAVSLAVSRAAGAREDVSFARALTGGDDYALLYTLPSSARLPQGSIVIGSVQTGEGVFIDEGDGPRRLAGAGYEHFAQGTRAS